MRSLLWTALAVLALALGFAVSRSLGGGGAEVDASSNAVPVAVSTKPPISAGEPLLGSSEALAGRAEVSVVASDPEENNPTPQGNAPAAAPPLDSDTDFDLELEKENYIWLRESLTEADIRAEMHEMQSQIIELVREDVEERFASGEYMAVDTNSQGLISLGREQHDPSRVSFYRKFPDGRAGKVVLPEANYPEAYAVHRRITWSEEVLRKIKNPGAPPSSYGAGR